MRLFRNKKNGSLYELVCEAYDATNTRVGTLVVIYKLHDMLPSQTFVREKEEFYEKFEAVH